MEHILYKTTNTQTKEYYIGIHSCKGKACYHWRNEDCAYLGSGNRLLNQIRKHGRSTFTRTTLSTYTNREDAFQAEKRTVNLDDPLSLNLAEGGQGHRNPNKRKGKRVIFEGVTYESIKDLAKEYGTSPEHASKWVRGITTRKGNHMPITIEGVEYESLAEAERITGYAFKTIQKFKDPSYVKTKAETKPVRVFGVDYETTGLAAKALGESAAVVRYRCLAKARKFKDWQYT